MSLRTRPDLLLRPRVFVSEHSGGDPVNAARVTGHSNPSQLMRYIGQEPPTIARIWKGVEATIT